MPRPQHVHVLLLLLVAVICICIHPAAAAHRPPPSKILASSSSSRAAYLSPLPPSRLLARTRAAAQRRREQPQQQPADDALLLVAAPLTFLRKLSPLLLGFLPMLAPPSPYRQASAVANAATLTTTASPLKSSTTMTLAAAVDDVMTKAKAGAEDEIDMSEVGEGEDGQRLMGRVEPIDKLGKEAEGIFKRARIAETDNEFEKALRLYDRVTRVAPGYAYAWSNKGNAYIALGDLQKGLDSYNRAIELLPSKTGDAWLVYLNKATTELALDKIDEAITDLELARVLHGQPDMLLFANKGLALERKGKFGPALENYEFAVMSKPKEVQPWWLRYSLVLFQEQQDIKSMEVMRKVAGKFGRVEEIKVALATIVYAYGDKNEAERMWSELNGQAQYRYRDEDFLRNKLRWPERMINTLREFKGLYTPKA